MQHSIGGRAYHAYQMRIRCVSDAYQMRTTGRCVPDAYQMRTRCVPNAYWYHAYQMLVVRTKCVPNAFHAYQSTTRCVSCVSCVTAAERRVSNAAFTQYVLCTHDTGIVRIWYASSTHMVHKWYGCGTHMVRICLTVCVPYA